MAINIQNIIAALEAKVAAANSTTETQELIVLIKTIKASGQTTLSTYANVGNLPAASSDNVGNIAYVTAQAALYFSNGTAWSPIGTGTSGSDGGDAVFDSALIGDVSIISNIISAIDSYGEASELNINATTLKVNQEENTGSVHNVDSGYIWYNPTNTPGTFSITISSFTNALGAYIESLSSGDLLKFNIVFSAGTSNLSSAGTGTIQSWSKNYYGHYEIYLSSWDITEEFPDSQANGYTYILAGSTIDGTSIITTTPFSVATDGAVNIASYVNVDNNLDFKSNIVSTTQGALGYYEKI